MEKLKRKCVMFPPFQIQVYYSSFDNTMPLKIYSKCANCLIDFTDVYLLSIHLQSYILQVDKFINLGTR